MMRVLLLLLVFLVDTFLTSRQHQCQLVAFTRHIVSKQHGDIYIYHIVSSVLIVWQYLVPHVV